MRTRGLPPLLLFLAAVGGVTFLGMRITGSEAASAERTARDRLRARAQEAAGILVAAASRAFQSTGHPVFEASVGPWGVRFSTPREPDRIVRRDAQRGSPDSEGAFFLAAAERAEAVGRDLDEARTFYGIVSGPGHSREEQATALFRLSALERRRGADAEARAAEEAFLAKSGEMGGEALQSLEALIARSRAVPPDARLRDDLLARLGSGDDGIVLGLLGTAGLLDAEAVRRRREELRVMDLLRPVLAPLETDAPAARILEGRIVTWTPAAHGGERIRSVNPRVRMEPLPTLPPEVFLGRSERADERDSIAETVTVGEPFDGVRITAAAPRSSVDIDAAQGAFTLFAVLTALLLAGGAAFTLAVRASRRETEAARARADFVTKVGHDLRTPLSVIRMYAETLAAGKVADPAEAREFASVAAREAERMTGLVGQVLDLSRVAEGEGALARRPLDLAALAAEVAEFHRPLLERAGMRLTVRVEGPLAVTGDSAALRGAVSNLLDNALRHGAGTTTAGSPGGEVTVEAGPRGRMAQVRVLDRGPGIPAGMEERLFERFVRGPEAAGHGAGLGLALVREAAEAHGGAAGAANREGGGAAFTLELPMAEAP